MTNHFHLVLRGNNRQAIFLDDGDRTHFLSLLAEAEHRYGWLVTAQKAGPSFRIFPLAQGRA